MPAGVLISFVGALQASVSVLLTIFSGVVAAQFGLLSTGAAEEVSSLCVKLLLPCLLISNLGSELHLETVVKYVPIISMYLLVSRIGLVHLLPPFQSFQTNRSHISHL